MSLVLVLLELPAAMMVLYLDVLATAAAFWHPRVQASSPRYRFALLIPAHDEEALLPCLLSSISALTYPRDLYDIHVVADNCTDHTADVAAAAGATVHVRTEPYLRGKGYALSWLLAELSQSGGRYDAYVMVDADTVVSPNLLSVFNAYVGRGAQAMQCYYGVLNAADTWTVALRYAALALYNGLRPRGREALGLSAGLRGNGMCFASALVERFGWDAFTLAEDAEFHLRLVAAGVRVTYTPEATVLAEMPTSLRQAHSQNLRWERGRLHVLRTAGLSLVAEGILRRDPARLDAVAEQLVPPLAVLTAMNTLLLVLSTVLRAPRAWRLSVLTILGQIGYVVTGLRLVHAGPRIYAAFLLSPIYIAWKLWIYAMAATGLQDRGWVRTERRRGAPPDA